MLNKTHYPLFLQWLLFASIVVFLFYLSYDFHVLPQIIESDVTRISILILCVFMLISLHCAWRCLLISHQVNISSDTISHTRPHFHGKLQWLFSSDSNWLQDYWQGYQSGKDKEVLAELFAEKLRGSNQIGWFFSSLIIKLGLLGTVIGFIVMLSSISTIEALAVDDIKNLMQQMTKGMGVAMNTTLLGLICSMLTGIQYLLLDRHCDRIVCDVVEHADKTFS